MALTRSPLANPAQRIKVALACALMALGSAPVGAVFGPISPAPTNAEASSPSAPSPVAAALFKLGLSLLNTEPGSAGATNKNRIVSPLSLAAALGLVQAGAAGATAKEIQTLLPFSLDNANGFETGLPELLLQLQQSGDALHSANRVWVDQRLKSRISDSYRTQIEKSYASQIQPLDFSQTEPARQTINTWVEQATQGHIPSLLSPGSLSPSSRVVLTNALHFKSPWLEPFDVANTANLPFHAADKREYSVSFMRQTMQVRSGTDDGAQVLVLPFDDDRFELQVAMSAEGSDLSQLGKELTAKRFLAWGQTLPTMQCNVQLPRFTIEPQTVSLKRSLLQMGMRSAFSNRANFSGMLGKSKTPVKLENVFQSVGIVIDETGGEAVAATAAVMAPKSIRIKPMPDCKVDRPFVFAVVHTASGAPLFMGAVSMPQVAKE